MPRYSQKKTPKKNFEPKANAWALLPAIVFVVCYIATAIMILHVPQLNEYFGTIPIMPSFIITLIVALQQNKNNSFQDKLGVVGRGIGNSSIIYMILIFILAGLFAGTVGRSSAASVAYFMLNFVPAQFSVLIIFVVSCFVSLAMGTSVGSVTLMMPIAISVSYASGQDIAVCSACVICGSMFGDNLSMISDTCIAACTGIGCEPKEKFFENLKIVLPAALISIVILLFCTTNSGNGTQIHEAYSLIDFVPYVLVLILSICGINVCVVLAAGIICGAVVMIAVNGMNIFEMFDNMFNGVLGMYEIIIITMLVAAISELIKENGGFAFILRFIKRHNSTKKGAQLSTGIIVALLNFLTANNTVAIVVASPIAKEVSKMFEIRRRRMASITDTFSCVVQGILPYGAQMMMAIILCNEAGFSISALDIIPVCLYQYILLAIVLIFILTGLSDHMPTWAKANKKSKKVK